MQMEPTNTVTMLSTSLLVLLVASGLAGSSGEAITQSYQHITSNTAGVAPGCEVRPCPGACAPCPRAVPPGYYLQQYPGGSGYYKMHRQWMDWFEAKATCEREGADLAVINSQEEADLLGRILQRHTVSNIYLYVGFFLYDQYAVTVLDGRLSSSGYEQWAPGEPNNVGACGMFLFSSGLYISNCSIPRQFICEM